MKLIPLTQGLFAMCDDEDYDFLMDFNWHARRAPRTWYAKTNVGGGDTRRRPMTMHQMLSLGLENIDHHDRNGLNNCKDNLRLATLSQNHGNQAKTTSKTTSRFKGVSWKSYRNRGGRWVALIGGGRREIKIRLGNFTDEVEAAKAYDEAAKIWFGEFARLNFP